MEVWRLEAVPKAFLRPSRIIVFSNHSASQIREDSFNIGITVVKCF